MSEHPDELQGETAEDRHERIQAYLDAAAVDYRFWRYAIELEMAPELTHWWLDAVYAGLRELPHEDLIRAVVRLGCTHPHWEDPANKGLDALQNLRSPRSHRRPKPRWKTEAKKALNGLRKVMK